MGPGVGLIFPQVAAPDETYERHDVAFTAFTAFTAFAAFAARLTPSWPLWLTLFSASSWFKMNHDSDHLSTTLVS